MLGDPMQVLSQFAAEMHKHPKTCDIGNANASLSGSREPFVRILSFAREGRKIRIMANTTWISIGVLGNFAVDPLSINKEDRIFVLEKQAGSLRGQEIQYPIFTAKGDLKNGQRELAQSSGLSEILRLGGLFPPESMQANRGELDVHLVKPTLERVKIWTDGLSGLAKDIEKASADEEVNYKALPFQFRPLIPLIKKWGIPDDVERENVLENAPASTLSMLIAEVGPYVAAIDAYLDSFKTEEPDEAACALGRLAECTIEAKHLLSHR
jgi:hypothetical protein